MAVTSHWTMSGVVLMMLSITSCLTEVNSDDAVDFQKQQPPLELWAAAGKDVLLPCDVTAPRGDRVNMVLWFKDSTGVPLYSLDARQTDLSSATHWSIATPLGSRAYFLSGGPGPAHLLIKEVRPEDEGVFRCRVDFVSSPTRNWRLNLTVIESPLPPVIFDDQGKEVAGTAGPFLEGFDLFLACHVRGGRRLPEVTWWRDGLLVDRVVEVYSERVTINRLFLPVVTRAMKDSRLECRARSSNRSEPVVREVPLEVYLKPLTVNIVTENMLLSVGKSHTLQCESSGSVPAARIVWLLDGEPIRNAAIAVEERATTTFSSLTFTPSPNDDSKELVCRADNALFPGGMLEERRHLLVAYAPIVSIHFETNKNVEALKEGDDMILVCDVRANPYPRSVTWFHEESELLPEETSGAQTGIWKFRLPPLTREMSGNYSCTARNVEGVTQSAPKVLRVQFSPRCRDGHSSLRLGAMLHQSVAVRCEVDADPGADDVRFSWTYNRSRDVVSIPAYRVSSTGLVSRLDYTPTSAGDYGTLACWARNSVGRQETPCYVHVVPPELPQPPTDCVLRNRSGGGLEVACTPGMDGDLPQHFLLEVGESPGENEVEPVPQVLGPPLYHVLGSEPLFVLHSLEPGQLYQLAVFAVNAMGTSDPPVFIQRVRVPESVEKLTGAVPESNEPKEAYHDPVVIVLVVLISAAVLIICVICTTLQVVRRRQASARKGRPHSDAKVVRRSKTEAASSARNRERSESIEMQKRELARWSGLGFLDEGGGTRISQFQSRNEPDLIFSRNEIFVHND